MCLRFNRLVPVHMKQLCLMLELKDSRELLEAYEDYHQPRAIQKSRRME